MIGNGEEINFSRILLLNETAAFVITELQKHEQPISAEELAESLQATFEVEYDEALIDVQELLHQLKEQDIVIIEY